MGVGGIGLAALGKDAEDLVFKLYTDLDDIGVSHRVDPERQADLAGDLFRQDLVKDGKERFRPRRGQVSGRFDGDVELEPFAGNPDDVVIGRILREGFKHIDDGGDVAGNGHGEPLGNGLPVPLHEDEGDHRLQQDHRYDDDQKRPGVEPGRDAPCEPTRKAAQPVRRIALIFPADGFHAGHACSPVCSPGAPCVQLDAQRSFQNLKPMHARHAWTAPVAARLAPL